MSFTQIIYPTQILPESWRKFFDGLSDNEKLIYEDLKGPSWSRAKKLKPSSKDDKRISTEKDQSNLNFESIKQASKDSVRVIMLIRAYRIRDI